MGALALAAGCNQANRQGEHAVAPIGELASPHVVDVAVAPVVDRTGRLDAGALRTGLQHALVDRLYSPLSLEWTDARWTEAGWSPGEDGADALLEVTVIEWDTTYLSTRGFVNAVIEARLRAPEEGSSLWAAVIRRRVEVEPEGDGLAERAARAAADAVGAALPERDPLAGIDG